MRPVCVKKYFSSDKYNYTAFQNGLVAGFIPRTHLDIKYAANM